MRISANEEAPPFSTDPRHRRRQVHVEMLERGYKLSKASGGVFEAGRATSQSRNRCGRRKELVDEAAAITAA